MEKMIRSHMSECLTEFAAHVPFGQAVEGFPWSRAAEKIDGLEHSMWMLVEHLRIVNQDFIDWVTSDAYTPKSFPAGYWPDDEPESEERWQASIDAVSTDLAVMKSWAEDENFPVFAPLGRKASHSASREILLAIAHNGYHIGQMVDLRALLGFPVKDW